MIYDFRLYYVWLITLLYKLSHMYVSMFLLSNEQVVVRPPYLDLTLVILEPANNLVHQLPVTRHLL